MYSVLVLETILLIRAKKELYKSEREKGEVKESIAPDIKTDWLMGNSRLIDGNCPSGKPKCENISCGLSDKRRQTTVAALLG